jgi:hypothetical protein
MSIRRIKNHGKWVWQARVAYQRLRKAAFAWEFGVSIAASGDASGSTPEEST